MLTIQKIPEKNAGYKIIAAILIDQDSAVVLGQAADPSAYVVWNYHTEGGFSSGYYADHYPRAIKRLMDRVD